MAISLRGKTYFITGASRGIGKAIALRLAKEGANIAVVAKSITEDPRLGGTIYTAAEEIINAGGNALAIQCDIRNEDQIIKAVKQTVAAFGGIDGVVNNASAISMTYTENTEATKFDLMHAINVRGTFLVTKNCLTYLKKSTNAHILNLSPPLNMNPKWLALSVAYTLSKYNMSMMAIGWAKEFAKDNIAANTLWPQTTIATSAIKNILGGNEMMERSRKPEILAEAAYNILTRSSKECTGNLFIDEDVLAQAGITDLSIYAINTDKPLQQDLFID